MNRNKVGPIFSILILAVAIMLVIFLFSGAPEITEDQSMAALMIAQLVAMFATLVFGALYMAFGYGKEVAKFYKLCIFACLVTQGLMIVCTASSANGNILVAALSVVEIAVLSLLCFAENLGKKKSRTCAIINLICNIGETICILVELSQAGIISILAATPVIAKVLISLAILLAVDAKYIDKDERGTV